MIELKMFCIAIMVVSILSFLMGFASYLLSEKTPNREKVSVYECGFDPFHTPGEPFSIRFFLIGMLFLVFDLEMALLFPWSITLNLLPQSSHMIIHAFILLLVLGLVYEWQRGGLEWE